MYWLSLEGELQLTDALDKHVCFLCLFLSHWADLIVLGKPFFLICGFIFFFFLSGFSVKDFAAMDWQHGSANSALQWITLFNSLFFDSVSSENTLLVLPWLKFVCKSLLYELRLVQMVAVLIKMTLKSCFLFSKAKQEHFKQEAGSYYDFGGFYCCCVKRYKSPLAASSLV